MIPNYYGILGLQQDASLIDIKKAYRFLALKFHPDINKDSDAHETFIEIGQAYFILSDNEARSKYDSEFNIVYNVSNINNFQDQGIRNKSYHSTTDPFQDEDLNNWSENAKSQAEKFSKMKFDEFQMLLKSIFKEASFQVSTLIFFMIAGVLMLSGVGLLLRSQYTGGFFLSGVGLVFIFIASNRWYDHSV